MDHKKIAILGATGHIAKGLIEGFCRAGQHELILFARAPERINPFLKSVSCKSIPQKTFDEFSRDEYDVIINCVGMGDPGKVKESGCSIFRITETFDNLALDYLEKHPKALYINFSSGAAYGTEFSAPAEDGTYNKLTVNHISPTHFYGIAKINSEAKHRALPELNIVDLRVFGYFSRFIDLKTKYFLSEIISCVKGKKEFMTGSENMIRDYVRPEDLLSLIEKCIDKQYLNDAFDVYSRKPATKLEILEYFSKEYGLKYRIDKTFSNSTATGTKNNYYSNNKKAEKIGYLPKYTSLQGIIDETKKILS